MSSQRVKFSFATDSCFGCHCLTAHDDPLIAGGSALARTEP
jgi:hypothetical protein